MLLGLRAFLASGIFVEKYQFPLTHSRLSSVSIAMFAVDILVLQLLPNFLVQNQSEIVPKSCEYLNVSKAFSQMAALSKAMVKTDIEHILSPRIMKFFTVPWRFVRKSDQGAH